MTADEMIQPYYNSFRTKLLDSFSAEDILDIDSAYELAKTYHGTQMRKSGEPYIIHPLAVANILLDLGLSEKQCIIAALLHDVVEDTDCTCDDVKKQFGEEVAKIVDGVTKLGRYSFASPEEREAENIRKMFIAMSKDVRIIIVKLADRLHNMRTIKFQTEEKQRLKAKETLDIYAPIAHRLGIRPIKEELEDLAIFTLDPVAYKEISDKLEAQNSSGNEFLDKIKTEIENGEKNICSNATVQGRIKSVHGIYRKMYMQNKTFEQIYDIYAVRIIVNTRDECWQSLGMVHDMYTPVNERFKDYTSNPKANGYQSIHTTVVGTDGIKFEVQIRTYEMHRTAEYGVAAHWKYKLGQTDGKQNDGIDDYYRWAGNMAEVLKDTDDRGEVLSSVRNDIAPEEVYAVTPRGKAICLPADSTVIDFAYAVHSGVGNKMTGAKVDGRIVPITYKVQNGEVIEIMTSSQPDKGPSRDWLNIVRTNSAKQKIRNWFKKERRDENIVEGKQRLESEMKRNLLAFTDENVKTKFLSEIAARYDCQELEDFYAKIGYGGILLSKAIAKISEEYHKQFRKQPDTQPVIQKQKKAKSSSGIVVEGIDNCSLKLSRCCNPIPGDDIIGFITRGYGVSIHKRDCTNVPSDISKAQEPERWIKASWDINEAKNTFTSQITIQIMDKMGMLAAITTMLSNMSVSIHTFQTVPKDDYYIVTATITVNSVEHLRTVMKKLETIDGVISVKR